MQQQSQQHADHQGFMALHTGSGTWNDERAGSGGRGGAMYDAPASASTSTNARQLWLVDYDRHAQQLHNHNSLLTVQPSARDALTIFELCPIESLQCVGG
ncbi:hypothetical protein EVG20_g9066 [Dentipellis fragilis]|uniref:Uncharacterized protein n=1 Tax=Dentipellis fragilis TaxID=205917 RepID=A0A4Y9Y3C1_9AGAM|nr:hypothetical protein EVG20_g9066 [Dentipellis fragilis]